MRRRSRLVSQATIWALFGALLLAAGCFAPIAAQADGGTVNLISTGSILARLILVAALSSFALILLRRRRALVIPAAIAGLMVLAEFLVYRTMLTVVSGANPPASAILSSIATEWGWALLVLGVALLLLAGLFPGRRRLLSSNALDRSGAGK